MASSQEPKKSDSQDLLKSVLQENHAAVRRFLRYLTRGSLPAEDLAQEVVLRAMNAKKIPDTESEIMTWLFRIARNLVIDEVRKAKRWREKEIPIASHDDSSEGVLPLPVPSVARQRVGIREMENILAEALEDLDEHSMELVTLRFFGGLSTSEIAKTQSLPVGTVCAKIFRATKKMKIFLEEKGYAFSELEPGE
ncbi:MAG: RNA polymerase sigma factor [Candidatus Omnitrophica bacterium]|nr:RNA polymerase sigma factor [Candidatus Omnitrophota bacterium]MCA9445828.1 RNA polymerase sigma factor [Candidatus Omnitrophota bacterium]MCB9768316.1 RNA polymerase sigma factor [Candidatus Omnitrophota bacterium]